LKTKSKKKNWSEKDIEDLIIKSPSLQKLNEKLWIKRPGPKISEDVIRKLNEKAFKACRDDDSHTKNLSD